MIGIYKITNKLNNKCYIGQAHDIALRWQQHIAALKTSNQSWYPNARNESNTIDDFDFTVLQECSAVELDELEEYWINYYNSFNEGYNKTINGQGLITNKSYGIKLIINYSTYKGDLSSSLLTVLKKLSLIKEITYSEKLLIILFLTQINNSKPCFITESWITQHIGLSHDTYITIRKHLVKMNILICNNRDSITLSIDNLFNIKT